MDVACYSILLVAVAIVGIQLTSPGSVSGQEEEESFITSIAQDGQNAQDGTQLTTPASVSGVEEEQSTIASMAQDDQSAQDGTQVTTPASVSGEEEEESTITPLAQDDQSAQNGPAIFPRIASVTDKSEVGADVTEQTQVSNGDDFDTDTDADTGADFANGEVGADGTDGIGRDGADGETESENGVAGVDSFALQLEANIP